MRLDNELTAEKLRYWQKYLEDYRLPKWELIPDLGLYMEQVVTLLKIYLDYLPPELKDDQIITAAAINNYVRNKIMPQPEKKKYYRIHIVYLIIICTLKQSLGISTLHALIPSDMNEDEIRTFYNTFAERHRLVSVYFINEVRTVSHGILYCNEVSDTASSKISESISANKLMTDNPESLIITSALISGFSRLLSERLLQLEIQIKEDKAAKDEEKKSKQTTTDANKQSKVKTNKSDDVKSEK